MRWSSFPRSHSGHTASAASEPRPGLGHREKSPAFSGDPPSGWTSGRPRTLALRQVSSLLWPELLNRASSRFCPKPSMEPLPQAGIPALTQAWTRWSSEMRTRWVSPVCERIATTEVICARRISMLLASMMALMQYCSLIKSRPIRPGSCDGRKTATRLNRLRNFIHDTIEVACSTDFQKRRAGTVDRSNLIK